MKDTKYLAGIGFKNIVAVDQEFMPYDRLDPSVKFVKSQFDKFEFPKNKFGLINAHYSLPFNPPKTFSKVWNGILASLAPGGVLVGQLFGNEDEWRNRSDMNFHTKKEMDLLLSGLKIIKVDEVKKKVKLASGHQKFWHVFHLIVQQPNSRGRVSFRPSKNR